MLKKQTTDYRQSIREAAELIHQEVNECKKIIEIEDCDDIFLFCNLGALYTVIMAKEHKRNSIKWEAALITVMESSLLVFGDYGFQYVEPDIDDCELKFKSFKKLISKKHHPKIKVKFDGVLERVDGRWHFNTVG